jgi:hypothetical protein
MQLVNTKPQLEGREIEREANRYASVPINVTAVRQDSRNVACCFY